MIPVHTYAIMEPPSKRSKASTPSDMPGPSTQRDNPYLAHRAPESYANGNGNGAATGSNGTASASGKVANPLNGLVPRKVGVDQAKKIMVSDLSSLSIRLWADSRMAMSTPLKAWCHSRPRTRRFLSNVEICQSIKRCKSSFRYSTIIK